MNTREQATDIAVIGCGTLGAQIAFTMAALGGHRVRMFDTSSDAVRRARDQMTGWCNAAATQGGPVAADLPLTIPSSLEQAVQGVELVIEAIPEDLDLKRELFARISALTDSVLATNSSSLKSRYLADVTLHPTRLLNLHFFLEPWKRNVVELMTCGQTDDEVIARTAAIMRAAKLHPIVVRHESTGLLFNRIWRAVKRETLRVIAEDVGDPEDVDRMWKVIFESPVGPCEMMDRIGLDVVLAIERLYANESGDAAEQPPDFLQHWVRSGRLGKKAGKGFFTYESGN